MKTNDIRDLAARIVGQGGRYLGEGVGYSYAANYDGTCFYANDTADLAEKIADYIGENVKTDILNRAE